MMGAGVYSGAKKASRIVPNYLTLNGFLKSMMRKLLQRWFNLAPWPDAEYIIGADGQKFWVDIDTRNGRGLILYIYSHGDWIGAVESLAEDGNTLTLSDIVIFEQYRHLRGKGLGRKMLQHFLTQARQKGISHITGCIQAHDGSTHDYLVEWYQRQGFDVEQDFISLKLD